MSGPTFTIEWDAAGYLWDDLGVYWDGLDRSIRGIIGGRSSSKRRKEPHVNITVNSYLCYVNGDPYITGNSPEGNGNVVKVVGEIPRRNVEVLATQLAAGQNTVNIKLLDIQKVNSIADDLKVSANVVVNNKLQEAVEYQKVPIIKAEPLVLYNR